ncbi:MAG: M23 family metallopeptidase [Holosporaceae bacterium]|jgi:murein DD-endopeptidase MepM/ murein hydrolase activator NlpD|nr:M23 family metallopeptidase [Holosporaceae bacterium]
MVRIAFHNFGFFEAGVVAALFMSVACERQELSPVEIKINGADLKLPEIDTAVLSSSSSFVTVAEHETLLDIAYRYNIDPVNFAKMNGIKPPYRVKEGQILKLPIDDSPSPKAKLHIEENGGPETKTENREKKKIDEEFAGILKIKNGKGHSPTKSEEQEKFLSTPKITKTAEGKPLTPENKPAKDKKISSDVKDNRSSPKKPVKMAFPVKNGKIISRYGDVKDGISNDGINIKAEAGSPVKAAAGGEVIYAGNKMEDFGNMIIIRHGGGLATSYAHLKDIKVKKGAEVRTGDVIGSVGKTGEVKEPQLHFEVFKNKTPTDPEKYLVK